MLRLLIANKIAEADTFLASQAGDDNILGEFMPSSANMPRDLSTIDITLLQEPY